MVPPLLPADRALSRAIYFMKSISSARVALYLSSVLLSLATSPLRAESGTWEANPVSGVWNNGANWSQGFPPNTVYQTATFLTSSNTSVSFTQDIEIGEVIFGEDASAYTFTATWLGLIPSGVGITNNSGINQNFYLTGGASSSFVSPGFIRFKNSASAGTLTTYNLAGGGVGVTRGAELDFYNTSTAASSTIIVAGNTAGDEYVSRSATVLFHDSSTAGNASITMNGGTNGGRGSELNFIHYSSGGEASVNLQGNSQMIISARMIQYDSMTLGSLEGTGIVSLGTTNLIVGGNDASTTFSGVIRESGKLSKVGTGTLTLSGSSSYTGGTTVEAGTLAIGHSGGAGIGTVTVASGATLRAESGVTLANTVKLQGGSVYQSVLAAGTSLRGAVNAGSDMGAVNTSARILDGSTTAGTTVSSSFSANSAALNDEIRMSDVYHFSGTGTDIFVLQLSMTNVTADSYLAWLNTNAESATFNQWVNAVEGNTGASTATFVLGAYNSATDFHLGYYGVDLATGTVWAVVNHNSDFAIGAVPEPSTWALIGLGVVCLVFVRRRALAARRG